MTYIENTLKTEQTIRHLNLSQHYFQSLLSSLYCYSNNDNDNIGI